MIVNLLEETLSDLRFLGHTESEILWVGNRIGTWVISWEEFKTIAKDVNYNCKTGGQQIAMDLVIVGEGDWWLERYESEGSEWWSYKYPPKRASETKSFDTVMSESRSYVFIHGLNNHNNSPGEE